MQQQPYLHQETILQVHPSGTKMAATGSEDAWQRTALISVECDNEAAASYIKLQYESMSETIDIDTGERDLDVINLLNLGQIPKHGAVGICTITFEGYPLEAGTGQTGSATRGTPEGGVAKGYFDAFAYIPTRTMESGSDADETQPFETTMTTNRTKFRVAVLWTDEADTTDVVASETSNTITMDTTVTAKDHSGKMLEMTSGTADGGYYMIVSNTTTVYTLTTGDTPGSDGVSADNTVTIHPTGSGALKAASKGMRFVLADCYCTSCKTSMTDGIVKQTLVFKGAMFTKTGAALCKMESNDGTAQLPSLGDYAPGTTYWA